jgi:hypothetical protein
MLMRFFSRVDIRQVSINIISVTGLLPIIGYGIVLMSIIDFIYVIFPLRLQNPEWEINTITALTNHSWAFLMGLGFIFSRYFGENQYDIRFIEIVFLKIIRWVLLVMGIIFLLLIPLVMLDTQRILKSINDQITQQQNNGLEQINQVEKRLASGVDGNQLRILGRNINLSPEELNLPTPQLEERIKKSLGTAKHEIAKNSALTKRGEWVNRWKNGSKTIISLVIIGFTFMIIWFMIGQAAL